MQATEEEKPPTASPFAGGDRNERRKQAKLERQNAPKPEAL